MNFVYFDVLYDYFLHPCGLHLVMDLWKEMKIKKNTQLILETALSRVS